MRPSHHPSHVRRAAGRPGIVVSAAALAAVLLAGCAGTDGARAHQDGATTASDPVSVVASTDVYGDIAEQIGGKHVQVSSIIDSPNRDPHEYQADARNQLAVSKADVVIVNGGGYDDFMNRMLEAAPGRPTVLNVATISGYDQHPTDGEFNEHLWYDFPTMTKLVDKLAAVLESRDAAHKADYAAAATAFDGKLAALEQTEAKLKTTYAGRGVAITEPVPLYLLDAIGLVNRTPEKFSEGIENGSDVAPRVLKQTLDLMSAPADTGVAALVVNTQAASAQTGLVVKAAHSNGVPVVEVTETLPAGEHYVGWMRGTLARVSSALARGENGGAS